MLTSAFPLRKSAQEMAPPRCGGDFWILIFLPPRSTCAGQPFGSNLPVIEPNSNECQKSPDPPIRCLGNTASCGQRLERELQ